MSTETIVAAKAYATPYKPPTLSRKGIEGCGESVLYKKHLFFYRSEKAIPRNGKIAFVKREGGWNHGTTPTDVEFLALAWNGKKFSVFASSEKLGDLCEWRNLTHEQAGQLLAVKVKMDEDERAKYELVDWSKML